MTVKFIQNFLKFQNDRKEFHDFFQEFSQNCTKIFPSFPKFDSGISTFFQEFSNIISKFFQNFASLL